jgi:hypothetical protein
MPDLMSSLQGHDLGHLRIIAEHWGLELKAPDAKVGLQSLVPQLLQKDLITETIDILPAQARAALDDLLINTSRLPWALFTRRYGKVHKIGAGRRDRQRPDLSPNITPAETLWYHGLLASGIFDAPDGPQEYAYIPDDLAALMPTPQTDISAFLGRPASPTECTSIIPASDYILDDACTMLAAIRIDMDIQAALKDRNLTGIHPEALLAFMETASILAPDGRPLADATRQFLEASRTEALTLLAQSWLNSSTCNDLRLIPGLIAEGEWKNDPLRARQVIIGYLSDLPKDRWWSLSAFVAAVQQQHPDFQRPTGEYESWYLRYANSDEYLRGFEHWQDVEGALLHYLITGPLHWLGIIDLAALSKDAQPTAFRFTTWGDALLHGKILPELQDKTASVLVNSDAHLRIARQVPRAVRYQLARFSTWEAGVLSDPPGEITYLYRLTPSSLAQAREQGLTIKQLLGYLHRHAPIVPPPLVKALEQWEKHGAQVRLEQLSVLRVASPEILQALRKSRAGRFLGDILGPTTVAVQAQACEKVLSTLAEMGYLGERVGDQ